VPRSAEAEEVDVRKDPGSAVFLSACPESDLVAILRNGRGPDLRALAGADYGVYVRSGALVPWWGGSFLLHFASVLADPLASLDAWLARAVPNGPAGPWVPLRPGGHDLPSARLTLRMVDPADRDNRYARALSVRTRRQGTSLLDPLRLVRAYVVEASPGRSSVLLARVLVAAGPWRPLAGWAILKHI